MNCFIAIMKFFEFFISLEESGLSHWICQVKNGNRNESELLKEGA